jgi:hypothetical protein
MLGALMVTCGIDLRAWLLLGAGICVPRMLRSAISAFTASSTHYAAWRY